MPEENDGTTINNSSFDIKGPATFGSKSTIHYNQHAEEASHKMKILLLFADPYDDQKRRLHLGTNERIIKEALRLSRYRDNISLTTHHATTIHDLRRALLDEEFQIVHIAGHGSNQGLTLEDEAGIPFQPAPIGLARLFQAHSSTLRCITLNACYSLAQGELIATLVPFVIAMEDALGDREAIEFSRGFYDAIGAGKDIEFAYEEGCRCVDVTFPDHIFAPKLFKKQ